MKSYTTPLVLTALTILSVNSLTAIGTFNGDSQPVFAQNLSSDGGGGEAMPFAISKTEQSIPDPTPGHEQYHQAVIVLPEREDGQVYAGTITYTSSLPLEVVILQPFNLTSTQNATAIPLVVPDTNTAITLLHEFEGDRFANEVFAGKSLALHSRSPQPFTVSYTVVGEVVEPKPLPQQ